MKQVWLIIKGAGFMALLALVGFALAIYTAFFYEKKPRLVFTASQPAKVLDVHRPIGGLEISYGGESLRGGENNLWLMSVVLRNEGNAEVRTGDYDVRDPVGLILINGQLLEQPSVQSESNYITKNLGVVRDGNSVHFAPVIIEPGEALTLSMIVLGSGAKQPELRPVGKVAGTPGVELLRADDKTKSGVLRDIFYAERWWVQALRAMIYPFVFLIGVLAFAAIPQAFLIPFVAHRDKKKKNERRRQINTYRQGHSLSAMERVLTNLYVDRGFREIREAYQGLSEIASHHRAMESLRASLDETQIQNLEGRYFSLSRDALRRARVLEDNGFPDIRTLPSNQLMSLLSEIEALSTHLKVPVSELTRTDFDEDIIEGMARSRFIERFEGENPEASKDKAFN
jgi:hypothetical protein